jgi:hypothetical protein
MNNAIVRSLHHHALFPSNGTFSALPSPQVGLGHIVAVNLHDADPLLVRLANGTTFHLGGLSDRQTQQLTTLLPDLINAPVWFHYDIDSAGQMINPRFKTLLIQGDSRQRASHIVSNNGFNNVRGVQHG